MASRQHWGLVLVSIVAIGCSSAGLAEGPAARSGDAPADASPHREVPPSAQDDSVRGDTQLGPCVPRLQSPPAQHVMRGETPEGDTVHIILLAPDERLCLSADPGERGLSELKLNSETVPLEQALGRSISVEFSKQNGDATLIIKNYYKKPLRYRALMQLPGQPKPQPTSTCVVGPGLANVEHWPHAIELLALGDFELLGADEPRDCR